MTLEDKACFFPLAVGNRACPDCKPKKGSAWWFGIALKGVAFWLGLAAASRPEWFALAMGWEARQGLPCVVECMRKSLVVFPDREE
jgi:hypothetical protein